MDIHKLLKKGRLSNSWLYYWASKLIRRRAGMAGIISSSIIYKILSLEIANILDILTKPSLMYKNKPTFLGSLTRGL
jgi:hypothetical protein